MERSGWFDDDEESSSQPPPEDRVWRHPSELGAHGVYGAPARRRHGLRFAGALALGSAGTLVFAVLTSMQLFGGELDRSGTLGLPEESTLFSITATTSLVRRSTLPPTASQVATTDSTAPVVVTTRPVTSMPPKVGVRVGGAEGTVPAVIDDDGYVLTGTDDLAGATTAEVVLDDGSHVGATVESVDRASGVARLKPDRKVPVPANQTMAWLGVTCSDDTVPADGAPASPAPADTTAPTPPPTTPPTTDAVSTTAGGATVRSDATVVSTAPAPTTAAPTTAASRAAAPATTATTAGAPATSAVPSTSTTVDDRPRVVATSVPVTNTVGPTTSGPGDTTTTTTPPPLSGVRVHRVHPDSPAAAAGVSEGDLILSVDDRAVHSRWALVLAVRRHEIGQQIRVEVLRHGARVTLDVVLAAGPTS